MAKKYKTLLVLFFLCSVSFGQTDLITLVDKANDYYSKGDYNTSIRYWDTISKMPFWFNNSFGVYINKAYDGDPNAREFIHAYSESRVKSKVLVKPIDLYFSIKFTEDENELKKLNKRLVDTLLHLWDTTTYSALFYTASYYELRSKEYYATITQGQMLEALSKQNRLASTYKFPRSKALKQYLNLMYTFEFYQIGIKEYREVLKIDLTLDMIRSINSFTIIEKGDSYFKSPYDIKKPIIELELKKEGTDELLKFAGILVSSYPSAENLDWLKEKYNDEANFSDFWLETSTTSWSTFNGNKLINNYLDSLAKDQKWIVLDVWGTWCSPCLQEMPHLNDMHVKFQSFANEPIKFLTLSYGSKNLDKFMTDNNYSFPVIETEKSDMQDIGVNTYPTTFLINNERKYVELPYTIDKQEAIRVFTLLDW